MRHRLRARLHAWLPAVLLLAALGGLALSASLSGADPLTIARTLYEGARASPWIIFLAYVARPLILFPASILLVLTGCIFGPWAGFAIAFPGMLLSALVAYGLASWVRPRQAPEFAQPLHGWRARLQQDGFRGVLLMRVCNLPFDAVNFGSAWLHVPRRPFLAASALGLPPGILAVVSFGAGIRVEEFLAGETRPSLGTLLDPWLIGLSVVLLSGGLYLAHRLRPRAAGAEPGP